MGDPSDLRYVAPSVANIPIDWSRVPQASKEYILSYDWMKEGMPPPATIGELAKWFDGLKFFGYFQKRLAIMLLDISEFGLEPASDGACPRFYMKYVDQVWFLLFTPGRRECILGYSHDIIIDTDDENTEDGEYTSDEEDHSGDEDMVDGEGDEDMVDGEDNEEMDNEVIELHQEAKEYEEAKEHEEVKEQEGVKEHEKDNERVKEVKIDEADQDEDDYEPEPEEPGVAEEILLAQEFDVELEAAVSRGMIASVKNTKQLGGWAAISLFSVLPTYRF